MAARMRLDTRDFDRTLVRYANSTKKELADILNTKAYGPSPRVWGELLYFGLASQPCRTIPTRVGRTLCNPLA